MEVQEDREQAIIRIRRCRALEALALLAGAAIIGSGTYYFSVSSKWDHDGQALLIAGAIVGYLILWLVGRRLVGARPIIANDGDFARWADEELEQKRPV